MQHATRGRGRRTGYGKKNVWWRVLGKVLHREGCPVPCLFGQAPVSQRGFLKALVKPLIERVSNSPRKLAMQASPKPYVHTDSLAMHLCTSQPSQPRRPTLTRCNARLQPEKLEH
jgi:hypothetical protein